MTPRHWSAIESQIALRMDDGLLRHVDFLVETGLYGINREAVIMHLVAAGVQRAVEIGIVEVEHTVNVDAAAEEDDFSRKLRAAVASDDLGVFFRQMVAGGVVDGQGNEPCARVRATEENIGDGLSRTVIIPIWETCSQKAGHAAVDDGSVRYCANCGYRKGYA
jgi:hypothetical protein